MANGSKPVGCVQQNCPLQQGKIWVYVKDDKGKGVSGEEITGPGTKKSDGSGFASFEHLAPQKYTVKASPLPASLKENFYLPEPVSQEVPLAAGETKRVNFQLKLKPSPTISVAAPKLVLVKHDYQGKVKPDVKPHRVPVKLGLKGDYDGVGELTVSPADVLVFEKEDDKDDKAKPLPWKIKAADLKPGKTVYIQAKNASKNDKGTELKLTLKEGTIPPKVADATEKITCVLLQLNVFKARPEDGSEPVQIDETHKIDPGRAVLVQGTTDKRLWAQRAKLVVARAKPVDHKGNLVLKTITGSVEAFGADKEKPAHGQTALHGDGLKFANDKIDQAKGTTLWVQGKTKSGKMEDTGWTVELAELPGQEGDRVTMTVLKTELRLFKSKTTAAEDPKAFSDEDKVQVGRYVHKQDGKRKRAKLVVRKVEPADFAGKLFLSCWNVTHAPDTEAKAATPRIQLFDAATAGTAVAFGSDIDQPAVGAADDLKTLWVQGKDLSTKLIDTQIRLGIKDVDNGCDRVSITVFQIEKVDVTLRGTPCKREAARVNAMAAGAAKNAAVAADTMRANTMPAKSFNTDSTVFGAAAITVVRECGDLKMAATVHPADVKLTWDIAQASDDAAKSDTPTHAADGSDKKLKVTANKTGSFNVFAFVDSNGDKKHNDDEDGVTVNVNMVEMTVPAGAANNKIMKNPAYGNARSGGGSLVVDSGPTIHAPAAGYRDLAQANYLISFKVTVKLLGGGADGLRGVTKITLGYIQQTTSDSVHGTYADGRTEKEAIYDNPLPASPVTAGAPAKLAFPVRDTRGAVDNGAGAFIISSQDDDQSNIAAGGQQRIVRMIDSPAIILDLTHPATGAALASMGGSNNFEVFLVGFSSDYDENFTAIAQATWWTNYGTFAAAAGWTNAGAAVHSAASMSVYSPAKTGESRPMERCHPNFVDNQLIDATR